MMRRVTLVQIEKAVMAAGKARAAFDAAEGWYERDARDSADDNALWRLVRLCVRYYEQRKSRKRRSR